MLCQLSTRQEMKHEPITARGRQEQTNETVCLITFEKRVQRTRGIIKTWCKIEMYTPKLPIAPTWGSYYIYIYIHPSCEQDCAVLAEMFDNVKRWKPLRTNYRESDRANGVS